MVECCENLKRILVHHNAIFVHQNIIALFFLDEMYNKMVNKTPIRSPFSQNKFKFSHLGSNRAAFLGNIDYVQHKSIKIASLDESLASIDELFA